MKRRPKVKDHMQEEHRLARAFLADLQFESGVKAAWINYKDMCVVVKRSGFAKENRRRSLKQLKTPFWELRIGAMP